MTARQLRLSMDSKELSEWMAFFRLESEEKPQQDSEKLGKEIKTAAFIAAKFKGK